jgi:hypothetical protein
MRTPKPWALPSEPATRTALSSSGVSDEMIRTQLRSGRLIRVRQGVYLARDAWPDTDAEQHLVIAHAEQAVNPAAVLSHGTAALVWGLPTPDFTAWHTAPPSVTFPTERHTGWSGGATRHVAALAVGDLARDPQGYAVTALARTAIDLTHDRPLPEALAILDHAARLLIASYVDQPRRLNYANPRLVAAAHEALLTAAGRRGSRVASTIGLVVPARESVAESLTAGHLHVAGTATPLFQAAIDTPAGKVYPDFFWPEVGLIGEVDGAIKYQDPRAYVLEKEREQLLRDLGYRIVRWLAKEIMTRPDRVVARIERALAA